MMQFAPEHQRTATLTANEPSVVLRFVWSGFWQVLGKECSESEVEAIKSAIQDYAWEHFMH
jgi:hypothetical protein